VISVRTGLGCAALALAVACGGNGGDEGGGAAGGGDRSAIKVGANLSLSGPAATLGKVEEQAIRLAVDQLNAAGGIDGRMLDLTVLDDATRAERAAQNAQRLITGGNVAIWGGSTGSMTVAMEPVTIRAGVLHIALTGPEVPGERAGPAKFHTFPPQSLNAAATLCWVDERLQATKLGLLHATDGFGQAGATFVPEQAGKLGIDVVATESFEITATNVTPQWTNVRAAKPDVAAVWASSVGSVTALQNARDLGIDFPILGTVALASQAAVDAAGPAAEGMVLAAFLAGADPAPDQAAFVTAFQERYKEVPDSLAAQAWDAVQMTALALREHAGEADIDSTALARTLQDMPVYDGLVAKYDYRTDDHVSVTLADYQFLVVEGGVFRRVPDPPACTDTGRTLGKATGRAPGA
jgi:branched-chain amino acid transport system substrate-binding protein